MRFFVTLCVGFGLLANVHAQTVEKAPLPGGALLARAPEQARWQITFSRPASPFYPEAAFQGEAPHFRAEIRYTFFAGAVLAFAGLVLMLILHGRFMALGGPKGYTAPEVE